MLPYADAASGFATVEFEPKNVHTFASSWPCFHGPERVRFTFERDTGDLVDMEPIEFGGRAASVMAEDAWSYFEDHRELDNFRGWLWEELEANQLADLARHGADTGFPRLTLCGPLRPLRGRHTGRPGSGRRDLRLR